MKKLESRTVKELIALAREWGVSGYSRLKKAELIKLLAKNLPQKSKRAENKPVKKNVTVAKKATVRKKKVAANASPKSAASSRSMSVSSRSQQARVKASRARLTGVSPKAQKPQAVESAPRIETMTTDEEVSLQADYRDGRIGLLSRDPHWLYCFWDLNDEQSAILWGAQTPILRVLLSQKNGFREVQRIALPQGSTSWYVHVELADRSYRCQLGVALAGDGFQDVLTSNLSSTPADQLARELAGEHDSYQAPEIRQQVQVSRLDELIPPPQLARAEVETVARQSPAPVQAVTKPEALPPFPSMDSLSASEQRNLVSGEVSGQPSSPVLGWWNAAPVPSSPESDWQGPTGDTAPTGARDVDYWLKVDADLVIYGATVPGSRVKLAGVEILVDDNGHFNGRFALPNGIFSFPVEADSPDEQFSKRISLTVQRETGK